MKYIYDSNGEVYTYITPDHSNFKYTLSSNDEPHISIQICCQNYSQNNTWQTLVRPPTLDVKECNTSTFFSIFNILHPLYEFMCIEGYIKQNCLSLLAQSLQPRKTNISWATYFVGIYLTAAIIINGSVNLSSLHSVLDIQKF